MYFSDGNNSYSIQPFTWIFVNPIGFQAFKNDQQFYGIIPEKVDNEQNCAQTIYPGSPIPQEIQNVKDSSEVLQKKKYSFSSKKNQFLIPGEKRDKIKKKEQEFVPYHPQIKKTRKVCQNSNRNVIPNVMHQAISHLQKQSKSEPIVEQIIKKYGLGDHCSIKRFYLYQKMIKDKLNYYMNGKSLAIFKEIQDHACVIYSESEQRSYNKISRVLIDHFFRQKYNSLILTSKRANSDKKKEHLLAKRELLESLEEIFTN